jgi:hypothetical protein
MPSIDFQRVRSIISISEVLDLLRFVAVARTPGTWCLPFA